MKVSQDLMLGIAIGAAAVFVISKMSSTPTTTSVPVRKTPGIPAETALRGRYSRRVRINAIDTGSPMPGWYAS